MSKDIKSRFDDHLVSSTTLDPASIHGLDVRETAGPFALVSKEKQKITIEYIAQHTNVQTLSNGEGAAHARPSMLAHLAGFCTNIRECLLAGGDTRNLSEDAKRDFLEWQGMTAAIALNQIYSGTGLKLSVERLDLTSENFIHSCIMQEMKNDKAYRDAVVLTENAVPVSASIFYICQDGKRFAVYHPWIGLCPMKVYDPTIFEGILPWYENKSSDCHENWNPVLEGDANRETCLRRIAWWAKQNAITGYDTFLTQEPLPSQSYISNVLVAGCESIDNVQPWSGKGKAFGTVMSFYCDADNVPSAMPQMYLDQLTLSYVGNQKNNCQIYHRCTDGIHITDEPICFADCPQELEAFAPVAPFHSNVPRMMSSCTETTRCFDARNPRVLEFADMIFTAKVDQRILLGVNVCAVLRNRDGEMLSVEKYYDVGHIRQAKLPYMMVWPYIDLPRNKEVWKSFYATWRDSGTTAHGIPTGAVLCDGEAEQLPTMARLSCSFGGFGNLWETARFTGHNAWSVCKHKAPLGYAEISGLNEAEDPREAVGIVYLPTYRYYNAAETPGVVSADKVLLSVDFGTTSTVAAVSVNGDSIEDVVFRDYSRCTTWQDLDSRKELDTEQWLGKPDPYDSVSADPDQDYGDWQHNHKIFSVAQLLQRKQPKDPDLLKEQPKGPDLSELPTSVGEYYVDGRLLLVSGQVLAQYAKPGEGITDPLKNQRIMTDMKFNLDSSEDVLNCHATGMFLAGVYEYAMLYLLDPPDRVGGGKKRRVLPAEDGRDYVQLRISYPNESVTEALDNRWQYAGYIVSKDLCQQMVSPIEHQKRYSEASAAVAYKRNKGAIQSVHRLLTMDIGGGTTDMSMTKNGCSTSRKLSVRYAGREIMVSSIIEYFRRFHANPIMNWQDTFESMWPGRREMADQFLETCTQAGKDGARLRGLLKNSSARMNVEMLLSRGLELQNGAKSRILRNLIAAKFFMLLKIAARFVRNNIDFWCDDEGKLNVPVGKFVLHLSVDGTSAQMLSYIFNCENGDLALLQGGSDSSSEYSKMHKCRMLCSSIFAQELADIWEEKTGTEMTEDSVSVDFHVSSAIRDKIEVCHGMLTDDLKAVIGGNEGDEEDAMKPDIRSKRKHAAEEKIREFPIAELERFLGACNEENPNAEDGSLINILRRYEKIFFNNSRANYGLGDTIGNVSDLLNICMSSVENSCGMVADNYAAYMIEYEQEDYQDLLICTYLVEECLNWKMAELQI